MARLLHCTTEEVQNDRFKACEKFISMYPGAVLVLKGAGTIIADKNSTSANHTGNPGMSKGGSGDVLTGIMGGSLVVESMFAIPGTGGMLVKSIFAGDHFLTVAILIFYSAISLVTILVVDLSYSLIDPRVRVGGGK